MREYFLSLLKTLDKLTGIRQYEKLCQTPNPKEEIKLLLDILCRVTDQFPYIPDDAKKTIISDAVIADSEFIGLNAKFVAKSLNMKKEFYLGKEDDVVIHPEALTGEARDKRIAELAEAINKTEVNFKVDKPYSALRERWSRNEGTEEYHAPNVDLVSKHQQHLDWVKANHDPRTGKPLPTWMPEKEWIEKQGL